MEGVPSPFLFCCFSLLFGDKSKDDHQLLLSGDDVLIGGVGKTFWIPMVQYLIEGGGSSLFGGFLIFGISTYIRVQPRSCCLTVDAFNLTSHFCCSFPFLLLAQTDGPKSGVPHPGDVRFCWETAHYPMSRTMRQCIEHYSLSCR